MKHPPNLKRGIYAASLALCDQTLKRHQCRDPKAAYRAVQPFVAYTTKGCARNLALILTLATLFTNQPGCAQPQRNPPPPLEPQEAEREALLGSRRVRVHDPSTIVKCKDEYWVFYTGRGVQSYHSKDLVKWEAGPRVFTNAPSWIAEAVPENRNTSYWAPDIIHLGDRYLLYYSVSSFGKNTSAIGLVTNPTLDTNDSNFQWTDQGMVIQSSPKVDFNTIDPAVFQDADGSLWMSFGSFWGGIKMIQLDPKTGKRIAPDSPIHSLAHYDSIEAPFVYRHDNRYYLFVNWGFCCRGTNSTYEICVGRSDKVTGPYLDKDGKDLLTSGGTKLMGTEDVFIGPGHAGILAEGDKYWFGFHFYNGAQRGSSTYAIRPLKWSSDGWPVVETPGK
jgi:arabinan endo-1,5-alpha-L-arabinosidase